MANRPVFFACESKPFYNEKDIEFKYYGGFSLVQKKQCVNSLHESTLLQFPNAKILEISTKSENSLGVAMSAFNLSFTMKNGDNLPFESVFQSSKVFENGESYKDLLAKSPIKAKRDPRIRESGSIISFELDGEVFPTEPKTLFYDWMYVNAMLNRKDLWDELLKYNAFTDIEFNPKRSLNCQARSAAIFVSLLKNNLLDSAVENQQAFLHTVYDAI